MKICKYNFSRDLGKFLALKTFLFYDMNYALRIMNII